MLIGSNKPAVIMKILMAALLLVLALAIYLPGLASRFLLDDYYNLHNLDQVAQYGYASYVFGSGFSGPLGRPISLFTFALQYASWPDNPAAFKLVNIGLHLVNGVLVFVLGHLLAGLVIKEEKQRSWLTVLATTLWLLHPMQVSTTLYVVQRMTEVSALFTLLGIIAYLRLRLRIVPGDGRNRMLLIMSMLVPGCTLLSMLAKENGILLPLYLLIIEGTLLAKSYRGKHLIIWQCIFLSGPLLVLVVYLAWGFGDVYRSYGSMDYSMGQKLLTETAVLTEYIKNILIPHPAVFGLYHDDFPVSQGVFNPSSTFISLAILFGLMTIAILKRKTLPVISFAIYWFLGGHVLESSYLNLELYFEHRNYLPSFGLLFLLAWLIIMATVYFQRKWVIYIAVGVYSCFVIITTKMEVDLWSKPELQAVEWSRRHPRSERAMDDLVKYYLTNNDVEKVEYLIARFESTTPDYIYPNLYRIYLSSCRLHHKISDAEWRDYLDRAGRARTDKLRSVAILDNIVLEVLKGVCTNVDTQRLTILIKRLLDNSSFSSDSANLFEYLSALAINAGDLQGGLLNLRLSIQKEYTVPRKLREILLLVKMGKSDAAASAKLELQEYIENNYRLQWAYGRMIKSLPIISEVH